MSKPCQRVVQPPLHKQMMKLISFSYRKLCWWSICTTTQKYGNQLVNMLPIFVDEVLLHPGEPDPVFRAATKAFAIPGVLDHTAIVIFHQDQLGNELGEQLTLSTPFLPWGLHLPQCENCSTTMWVCCKSKAGPMVSETQVKICCSGCNWGGGLCTGPQMPKSFSRTSLMRRCTCALHILLLGEWSGREAQCSFTITT